MGGGHYKPAGACGLEYYFSEYNVHAQCTYCNLTLQGDKHNYRERLIKKYGKKVVEDIDQNYHKPCKDFPFLEKIEEYKQKLSTLQD